MKIYQFDLRLGGKYQHPKLVRKRSFEIEQGIQLNSPKGIYELAVNAFHLDTMAEEYVYCLCFDTAIKNILGIFEVSHGSVNSSIVNPREILIRALLCGVSSLILLHNHPSGIPDPSREDIKTTERVQRACQVIGVSLLDHVIVGKDGRYFSFGEAHLLG